MDMEKYKLQKKKLKLTEEKIAKATGVKPNTVSKWFMGIRNPNPSAKILLDLYLEIED